MQVGIEAINVFGGSAFIDVMELAAYRKLDIARFENLLMRQKSVALPYEDPVTFAVNAPSLPVNKHRQSEHASENSSGRSPSVNAELSWPVLVHAIAAR